MVYDGSHATTIYNHPEKFIKGASKTFTEFTHAIRDKSTSLNHSVEDDIVLGTVTGCFQK